MSEHWHKISNIDTDQLVGDCSVCGSGVPVRPTYNRPRHLVEADGKVFYRCKRKYEVTKRSIETPWVFHKKDVCEECGFIPQHDCQLTVDHIDGNKYNNEISNYQTLCHNCHALKTLLNGDYFNRYSPRQDA